MADPEQAPPATPPPSPHAWAPRDVHATLDAVVALALFFIAPAVVLGIGNGVAEPWPEVHLNIVALLAGFLTVVVYWLARGRPVPLAPKVKGPLLAYAAFLVVWFPFAFWLYPRLVRACGYDMPAQEMLKFIAESPGGWMVWVAVLTACVAAPLGEELLFRGFLYRPVELWLGPWFAMIATSLLFGLMHEPSVVIPITLLGGLFALVRHRTGGVFGSMLVHAVHNTITVGLVLSYPDVLKAVFDS